MSKAGSPSVPLTTGSVADLFAAESMIWTVLLDTGRTPWRRPRIVADADLRAAGVLRARPNAVPNTQLLHSTNGACGSANQPERAEMQKRNAGARPAFDDTAYSLQARDARARFA